MSEPWVHLPGNRTHPYNDGRSICLSSSGWRLMDQTLDRAFPQLCPRAIDCILRRLGCWVEALFLGRDYYKVRR